MKQTRIINRTYFTINAETVHRITQAAFDNGLTVSEAAAAAFGEGVTVKRLYTACGSLWGAEVDISGAAYVKLMEARKAAGIAHRNADWVFVDCIITAKAARKAA